MPSCIAPLSFPFIVMINILFYCLDELQTGVNAGFRDVDAAFLRWREYDAGQLLSVQHFSIGAANLAASIPLEIHCCNVFAFFIDCCNVSKTLFISTLPNYRCCINGQGMEYDMLLTANSPIRGNMDSPEV